MSKAVAFSLVLLIACGPAGPRGSLLESRSQWSEELETELMEGSVIRSVWELKEKLKKDYTKFIGPPAAFNELMDLKFTIAVNEMMLEFPGYYESVTQRWVRSNTGPPPGRQDLSTALKILRRRTASIEEDVAESLEAAEKETIQDAARREQVYRILAGIVLLTLAVPSWKNELLAVTPPYKYVHGRYVIYRHASELIIDSPLGRTTFCRPAGRHTLGEPVCN